MLPVLHLPDFRRTNPYQSLLEQALSKLGVQVNWSTAIGRWSTLRAVQAVRPKILHLHWTSPYWAHSRSVLAQLAAWRFMLQLWLIRRAGVPIVWTIHNLHQHESSNLAQDFRVNRQIFKQCATVFVHCQSAVAAVIKSFGLPSSATNRIEVIPHGNFIGRYKVSTQRDKTRAAINMPSNALLLLHFGQLRTYKGIETLLACIEQSRWHLLIVGNPVDKQLDVKIRSAEENSSRIVYRPGFVAANKLADYLAASDAVALPFRNILMSSSAVLAMSAGKPLLLPRLGCLPAYIGETGAIYFKTHAPNHVADSLDMLALSDLISLGQSNRQRVQQFRWEETAERTASVYRALLQ